MIICPSMVDPTRVDMGAVVVLALVLVALAAAFLSVAVEALVRAIRAWISNRPGKGDEP